MDGDGAVEGDVDGDFGSAGRGGPGTRAWVDGMLPPGARVTAVERLKGGWTSEMRRLRVEGGPGTDGGVTRLVLRSFHKPFFVRHAEGLLNREADVLRLLRDTDVPAASLVAVDATAAECDHPSLLMSCLPGRIRLDGRDAGRRSRLLARQLAAVHALSVPDHARPRTYQPWTSPESVRPPGGTSRPELWRRAVRIIGGDAPEYRGRFLHRDFHPGNVLFEGDGPALRVSGVVDWVETSYGPADLDVAHCSTALALLHGPEAGMRFAGHYLDEGGTLAPSAGHLYWRLLDALAFAPDAEKVAGPWRESGRGDLTPGVLARRLDDYVGALFAAYG